MLYTNLKHIDSASRQAEMIHENEHVVIICGRMGASCIPVYRAAEELEDDYPHVKFFDMEFDDPQSAVLRSLPEVKDFQQSPFVIYYKNGLPVKASSGLQTKAQMIAVLELELSSNNNA